MDGRGESWIVKETRRGAHGKRGRVKGLPRAAKLPAGIQSSLIYRLSSRRPPTTSSRGNVGSWTFPDLSTNRATPRTGCWQFKSLPSLSLSLSLSVSRFDVIRVGRKGFFAVPGEPGRPRFRETSQFWIEQAMRLLIPAVRSFIIDRGERFPSFSFHLLRGR